MRDARAARLGEKKRKEKKRKRGTSVFDLDSRARTVAAIPRLSRPSARRRELCVTENLRGMKGEDFDPVSLSRP